MSFKEQLLQLFDDDGMISFLKIALFCLSPTQLNLNELYVQSINWFKFSYCFRIGGFRSLSGWRFGYNSAKLKLDNSFIYCSILCLNIFSLGAPLTQKVEQYTCLKYKASVHLIIHIQYLLFVFQQTWFSHFCLLFRGLNLEGNHHYYIHL